MTVTPTGTGSSPSAAQLAPASSRRWLGLACISVAQLMVALDATIINIALPSAQRSLGAASAMVQHGPCSS